MSNLLCECQLCIYWGNHHCQLEQIELDELGVCKSAILVDIPEDYLRNRREALAAHLSADENRPLDQT